MMRRTYSTVGNVCLQVNIATQLHRFLQHKNLFQTKQKLADVTPRTHKITSGFPGRYPYI